ncbi:hypothetical protein [Spiroplasma endosymbiont of Virgichneumon dumeticola]|uniref:hypothetical protein n=1 Tax=Spiroplasma endosymbiont of Virgichneumon dumeticola TaxID=3139323 RepID=UPI0035C8DC16
MILKKEKVSDLKKQILPTISELDENKLPSTNSVQMEQVNIFNISTQIEILKEEVKILESNFPKTMKMIPEHVKQTIKSTNEKLEKQQKEMSKNNKNKKFNNSISSISYEISDKDIIEMHYGKNHICSIV